MLLTRVWLRRTQINKVHWHACKKLALLCVSHQLKLSVEVDMVLLPMYIHVQICQVPEVGLKALETVPTYRASTDSIVAETEIYSSWML